MIGRLLGIDHGEKRIGIAVSDALGLSARELTVLRCQSTLVDFAEIREISERECAVGIVVGVPHNPNAPADIETQADAVRAWIRQMREVIDLPIVEVSEYLTSVEARQLAGLKKRGNRDPIDDLAACVILQSYLDALSYGSATFPPPRSASSDAPLY